MSRYIDAAQLKNDFTNWREIVNNPYDLFPSVEECKAVIDAQPPADVQEVRHGRWIWDDEGYHCSECFFHAYGNTLECLDGTYRYCPNCGSRMDLDGDTE